MKNIYVVFDSKAEAYNTPFFMGAKGEAIRGFETEANNLQSMIGQHPSDFTLFELGTYDEKTAKFQMHKTPISLGVAIEFKKYPELSEVNEA